MTTCRKTTSGVRNGRTGGYRVPFAEIVPNPRDPPVPDPVVRHSPAWILSGVSNTPGFLALSGGHLSFVSRSGGIVFDEPLGAGSRHTVPWYYFSGGLKRRSAGRRRRIS